MTDTTRKIPQVIDPRMVSTLLDKRDELLAERASIRKARTDLARRDREIDRDLADLQAAGRVFGIAVDLPKDEGDADDSTRHAILKTLFTVAAEQSKNNETKTPAAKAVATKAEMPRVSDIVLDRLKEAGKAGTKAAPIQHYIETTYGTKIHDKTVGMTLYRLQKDGLVRRDGYTWFIAGKAMNPGAATPGPSQSQEER